MKYLKKFEDLDLAKEDIQFHLDEVKSIFQEYIDEYDIELIPDDLDEDDNSRPGLYYNLYSSWTDYKRKQIGFELPIYIYWNGEFSKSLVINRFYKFYDKLEDMKSRLESMGYNMRYDGINKEEFSEDPDGFFIKISYFL